MKKLLTLPLIVFLATHSNAQQPSLVIPIGHTFVVNAAHFSPNGKKVLTTSWDRTAKIWDANTGALLASLQGHTDQLIDAQFSPDGSVIVTVSDGDQKGKLWDANTGILLTDLIGHGSAITQMQFSNDGKKFLTTGKHDHKVITWETASGKKLVELKDMEAFVRSARFSPDGAKVVSVDGASIKVWDAVNGSVLKEFPVQSQFVNAVDFSRDGTRIVSAGRDGQLKIWDAKTGKLLYTESHSASVNAAAYTPDGESIISFGSDSTVNVWDAKTLSVKRVLRGFLLAGSPVSFSPDGKKLVSTFNSGHAQVWNIADGKLLMDWKDYALISTLEYNPEGTKLVMAVGNAARIIDVATGFVLHELKGHTNWVWGAHRNPDGKNVVMVNNSFRDIETGKVLLSLNIRPGETILSARISPGKDKIVTTGRNKLVKIWNAASGALIAECIGHKSTVWSGRFSPDGTRIVTAGEDGTAKLWDATTGSLLADMRGGKGNVYSAEYSNDGKRIVTSGNDKTVRIWDAKTGLIIRTLDGFTDDFHYAEFSSDDRMILGACWDKTIKIWDANTYALLRSIDGPTNHVNMAGFSPDGKRVYSISYDENNAKIWDVASGVFVADLKGHNNWVYSAQFSKDGKRIVTASWDNTAKVWNAQTGELLYTLMTFDSTDYLIQIKGGYYKCTANAAKLLHYVTRDLKVITFEQLDVKYNRPDKVVEVIGGEDSVLSASYRKAYYKRIKKLGLDTSAFRDGYGVPEADFTNRYQIDFEQKNETLALKITGQDSVYKLDRLNLWINEVPLFGLKGISLRGKKAGRIDTTLMVKLSEGQNKIEVSVTNMNGTESYRIPLIVKYLPAKPRQVMHYFVGIGIDKFADSRYNLNYSSKDIRDLCLKLKAKYGEHISVDTLFNERVTVQNVKAIRRKLLNSGVNDQVMVSYSGHGLLSKDFDYYLSTYSINFDKPEQNGLLYDELEHLMDSIPARKKLLLIDACHSGEVDKEDIVAINKTTSAMHLAKGSQLLEYDSTHQVGLKNSFELMQTLFVNVGKNTGAVIISAAAGNQFALESGNLKNGVFTYSILEAMNMYPTVKVSELKKIVSKRVEQLTDGMQKPTFRSETIGVDWDVW